MRVVRAVHIREPYDAAARSECQTPDVRTLDLTRADALVLSACVQMPSLPAVQQVEDELGLPVVTASTATARSILQALGVTPRCATRAGSLAG